MSRFVVALCASLLFGAAPAQALVQRAYVSALTGNDANTASNCPATAPCRWFAGAISVVAPGGEIVAMDTGAYGTVTITKSIAIVSAPGAYAGITVFAGNGVTVATAGVNVVLRGLTINNLGGDYGIAVTGGTSISIENCIVANFNTALKAGLYVDAATEVSVVQSLFRGNYRGAMFTGGATARVSDSRFMRNQNVGVYTYSSSAGTTRVSAERTVSSANGLVGFYTFASAGSAYLALTDVLVSENADHGIEVQSTGGSSVVSITSSLISHNGDMGVYAYGAGTSVLVSDNTITRNDYGLYQAGSATFQTTGDNRISENTTSASSGTITTLTKL
ncbi:hypothetical protein BURK2_01239 [Burkholderiales bacterium]|nr:MAG: right-handed parallel beta-helix repeat-containing protein [Burkholderiales bacterium]CAG0970253.1 hypothetical protein BURK2_01239 [Burkholderiales bacterium]